MAYQVLLDAFPDVEAFMVCSAYFKLTKEFSIAGFGTARVTSYVTILALDRNRQVILRKSPAQRFLSSRMALDSRPARS